MDKDHAQCKGPSSFLHCWIVGNFRDFQGKHQDGEGTW